jgi:hypothetical protein
MLDPARARKNRSIDSIYAPFLPPFHGPYTSLFMLLYPALGLHPILFTIRYALLLLVRYALSHLASSSTFLFSRLAPQSTRLRLKQLKKPRVAKPPPSSVAGREGKVRLSEQPTLKGLLE